MSTNRRKSKVNLGSNEVVPVVVKAAYDFASEGGTIGAITLKGEDNEAVKIPAGALITRVWKNIRTTLASSGAATLMLGTSGDTDAFIAATAFDNAANVGLDAHSAAVPQKVGAGGDVSLVATIAGADLTAGAFDLYVEYLPPRGRGVARD